MTKNLQTDLEAAPNACFGTADEENRTIQRTNVVLIRQPAGKKPRGSVPSIARLVELMDSAFTSDWESAALCAQTDPEEFYPERGGNAKVPKRICSACPVRDECLAYALATDERFGIWGGLSERERRNLQKQIAADVSGAGAGRRRAG